MKRKGMTDGMKGVSPAGFFSLWRTAIGVSLLLHGAVVGVIIWQASAPPTPPAAPGEVFAEWVTGALAPPLPQPPEAEPPALPEPEPVPIPPPSEVPEAVTEPILPPLPPEEETESPEEEPEEVVPPAPPPVQSASGNEAERADYAARLAGHIAQYKFYPPRARRLRLDGQVLLRFTLAEDGRLLQASIAASSGSPLLDRTALEVLRRASPMPAPPTIPPATLRSEALEFTLPLIFNLE